MSKYNNERNDPRLIHKFATRNTLCSIIAPDINSKYENVILEFVDFDAKTFKKIGEIDIYFDLASFLGLCQFVVDKTITRGVRADKANMIAQGKKYSDCKSLCFKRGGGTVNGVVKYREFYIQASSASDSSALLVAEECDGYKDKTGLINPKSGNNNKKVIRIPVDFETLFNVACLSQSRINAFFVAKQLSGAYDRSPRNASESVSGDVATEYTLNGTEAQEMPQNEPQSYPNNQYQPGEQYEQGGVPEIDPDEAFYAMYASQYN